MESSRHSAGTEVGSCEGFCSDLGFLMNMLTTKAFCLSPDAWSLPVELGPSYWCGQRISLSAKGLK